MDASTGTGLRPARVARGWSQSEAARELQALARARGAPVAAAASLKTLLSRWENGHALPEPQYRTLLGALYERTPAELGVEPPGEPAPGTGQARLRAAIAAAAAVDRAGTELWWQQLAAARRLDDELGAAGAAELVTAQVDRLDEVLTHTTAPVARAAVAAVLAAAAALAGAQSLDRGRHDEAWRRYQRARTAAGEAGLPVATSVAVAGQAEVLADAGEPGLAVALLDDAGPATSGPAEVRLAAARSMASAATGEAVAARAAIAAAGRRLRTAPADVVLPGDGPPVELADLHRWHGRALVALGDTAAAAPLERALAERPRSVRDRAAVHADLALALRAERPDVAAAHARTARELALGTGSERIAARLAAF